MNRKDLGNWGEDRAAEFLRSQGYRILERSYRTRLGELDLVAQDGETLVFVEVKTRTGIGFGLPQEAVNFRKQRHMVQTALAYIKEKGLQSLPLRFDVVAISPEKTEHIPNAFQPVGYAY